MKKVKVHDEFESLKSIGIATAFFEDYQNEHIELHGVDVVLLSLIIKGRGVHYLGSQRFAESGKSLAVTHYGEYHSIVSSEKMQILNIYLDLKSFSLPILGEELDSILATFLPRDSSMRLINRIYRLETNGKIEELAKSLHEELLMCKSGYLVAVKNYFRLFLIECCRQVKAFCLCEFESIEDNNRIFELCNYLAENFEKNLTLDNLAKRSCYQKNYLCKKFKAVMNQSIFEYITELRVQKALYLLRTSDENIISIALKCGFSDVSYFSKIFKRQMQFTPLEFRKLSLVAKK